MTSYSLSHLSDPALLHGLATIVTRDRITTAVLLAHLAEVDERRLYVPAAYDSMHAYCVAELRMSEDVAFKRIRVARMARQLPAIFPMLEDGRLSLSAVLMLTPHLTSDAADTLLAGAVHKTNAQVELLLAERFPKADIPTIVQPLAPSGGPEESAPRPEAPELQLAVRPVAPATEPSSPAWMEPPSGRTRPSPLSPGRYAVQFTMDEEMHEELRQVQALFGHVLPSGDVVEVFRRALHELRQRLEKQKFAKSERPRTRRGATRGRHIPSEVKRTVWQRDGGQCTFVSERGKRCESRTRLEYDHVEAFARGGQATVGGIRLRCRAHNQYAAECTFGSEFMRGKREQGHVRATRAQAEAKTQVLASEQALARAAAETASQEEVIPWLRALGCNAETARRAATRCAGMVGAPLEKRVRVAVQSLGPPSARRVLAGVSAPARSSGADQGAGSTDDCSLQPIELGQRGDGPTTAQTTATLAATVPTDAICSRQSRERRIARGFELTGAGDRNRTDDPSYERPPGQKTKATSGSKG
jgi:hypothetical protein